MIKKVFSPLSRSMPINGRFDLADLGRAGVADQFRQQAEHATRGEQVHWGLTFDVDKVHVVHDESIQVSLPGTRARWICFLHSAEDISLPGQLWNAGWGKNGLADWQEFGRAGHDHSHDVGHKHH